MFLKYFSTGTFIFEEIPVLGDANYSDMSVLVLNSDCITSAETLIDFKRE